MILVTGGAGFIGSNLVNALSENGYEVFICDYSNVLIKSYFVNSNFVDKIIDPSKIFEFLNNSNIKIIFHLGAISSTTFENNHKYWVDNVLFSTKLWNICSKKNIRLIYASSAATYGNGVYWF